MEEVLDIYKLPYDPKRPILCMDESSKQLVKEVKTSLKTIPRHCLKYDTEYERNGTANIFIVFEPLQGVRFLEIRDNRKKEDWAVFIRDIVDNHYSEAEKVLLVVDNLNIHHKASFYETFDPQEAKRIADRLEIHYTPKHGSWLNMAEIELSHLSRQCFDRRIGEKVLLSKEAQTWAKERNNKKPKMNWKFTTADARIKLKRLYPSILS
jgi:hypothetical protein